MFLAMYGDKIGIGEALFISAFAMIVVFFVLLIISYLIDLTAFITNTKTKSSSKNILAEKKEESGDLIETQDNSALVAVIAAAIASYIGTNASNLRITKIRRLSQNNLKWK